VTKQIHKFSSDPSLNPHDTTGAIKVPFTPDLTSTTYIQLSSQEPKVHKQSSDWLVIMTTNTLQNVHSKRNWKFYTYQQT